MRRILTTAIAVLVAATPALSQEWNYESNQYEIRRLQQQNRVLNAEQNAARAQYDYQMRYGNGGGYYAGNGGGYYNPGYYNNGNSGKAATGAIIGLAAGAIIGGIIKEVGRERQYDNRRVGNGDTNLGRVQDVDRRQAKGGYRPSKGCVEYTPGYGNCNNVPYHFVNGKPTVPVKNP